MKNDRESIFWESLEILEDQHWISASFRGRGDFTFAGNFRFSGQWQGAMFSETPESHLYVRSGAQISGHVSVARVSVEGQMIDVDVEAEIFHALRGARVVGRVNAKKIIVDEGAIVEGRMVSAVPEDRKNQLSGRLNPKGLGVSP
jgi:cytoskeletal protein CcmA (bactofilin family)